MAVKKQSHCWQLICKYINNTIFYIGRLYNDKSSDSHIDTTEKSSLLSAAAAVTSSSLLYTFDQSS
jgi:hypothetical protein